MGELREARRPAGVESCERCRWMLGAIVEYIAEHGYPPAVVDLLEPTGLVSTSSVAYHLDAHLVAAGLIVRAKGLSRGMAVTPAGLARYTRGPEWVAVAAEGGSYP